MIDPALEDFVARFQTTANSFAQGDPEPLKALWAHTHDVVLANPFGPAARGWEQVSAALDDASSRFRDGSVTSFERIAAYGDGDVVTVHDREKWEARVGDRADITPWELRVTTTFRREEGEWRIVHRHADPIASVSDAGPLRTF